MKVIPVASPQQVSETKPNPTVIAKAVAAFNAAAEQPASNHSAQLNQNAISPEDMSAIVPQSQGIDKNTENVEQVQAVEAPAEKQERDPALSRQFAQLARQEKALRARAQQQEQQWKARDAELKAKEAELSSKAQQYSQGYISKDQLKQDALSVLAEAGVSYEELTQQILNQQPTDPRLQSTINRLESKIKQLEESAENSQKTQTANQQAQYQAAVKQIESDTKALVRHDPNFEAIRATNSVRDVVELITQTYDKDGVLLTVEEAAQQVENYLVEEAMKITRIGKIKSKLEQANASQAKAVQKTQAGTKQTQPGQMKTLTNAASSSRQLSARERALLAFKGELKG
jgi:hypothetical protein